MPKIISSSLKNLKYLSKKIKDGEVVAIPTETVYGLAADATNSLAISKIFEYKNRPVFNPLIVHYDKIDDILIEYKINTIENKILNLMNEYPITLILEKKNNNKVSLMCSNGSKLQAVRIPQKKLTKDFIKMCGVPLAAPSANKSNGLSPTMAKHVEESLSDKDFYILEGGTCEFGIESTILYVVNDMVVVLRYGAFDVTILNNFGIVLSNKNIDIVAPGNLNKHYSPKAKIRLNANKINFDEDGLLMFGKSLIEIGENKIIIKNLSESGNLLEAAANLFKMLWEFDDLGIKKIAISEIPLKGLGIAINDRLKRASVSYDEM